MSKTITIIGNIGSGKTTLAKILAKQLPGVLIDADPFESNPFLPLYAADHARWALATELFFTLSRAQKLEAELSKNKSKTKIIDSGLLMGIEVYAKHHLQAETMTQNEWSLFKTITKDSVNSKLIYPELVIYCECEIQVCHNRIEKRGRRFEKNHSVKYLHNLDNNLRLLTHKLKKKSVSLIKLDMTVFDPRVENDIKNLTEELTVLV